MEIQSVLFVLVSILAVVVIWGFLRKGSTRTREVKTTQCNTYKTKITF
jgi:membrane protein implicated in regulation of membrane protease activity